MLNESLRELNLPVATSYFLEVLTGNQRSCCNPSPKILLRKLQSRPWISIQRQSDPISLKEMQWLCRPSGLKCVLCVFQRNIEASFSVLKWNMWLIFQIIQQLQALYVMKSSFLIKPLWFLTVKGLFISQIIIFMLII